MKIKMCRYASNWITFRICLIMSLLFSFIRKRSPTQTYGEQKIGESRKMQGGGWAQIDRKMFVKHHVFVALSSLKFE